MIANGVGEDMPSYEDEIAKMDIWHIVIFLRGEPEERFWDVVKTQLLRYQKITKLSTKPAQITARPRTSGMRDVDSTAAGAVWTTCCRL